MFTYLIVAEGTNNRSHCGHPNVLNVLLYLRDCETCLITVLDAVEKGARAKDWDLNEFNQCQQGLGGHEKAS